MPSFNVGDQVCLLRDYPDGNYNLLAGSIGVVCDKGLGTIGVKWHLNKPSSIFHNCGGRCDNGYGWYVSAKFLEKYEEETYEISESELMKLIGG